MTTKLKKAEQDAQRKEKQLLDVHDRLAKLEARYHKEHQALADEARKLRKETDDATAHHGKLLNESRKET